MSCVWIPLTMIFPEESLCVPLAATDIFVQLLVQIVQAENCNSVIRKEETWTLWGLEFRACFLAQRDRKFHLIKWSIIPVIPPTVLTRISCFFKPHLSAAWAKTVNRNALTNKLYGWSHATAEVWVLPFTYWYRHDHSSS